MRFFFGAHTAKFHLVAFLWYCCALERECKAQWRCHVISTTHSHHFWLYNNRPTGPLATHAKRRRILRVTCVARARKEKMETKSLWCTSHPKATFVSFNFGTANAPLSWEMWKKKKKNDDSNGKATDRHANNRHMAWAWIENLNGVPHHSKL